MGKALIIAEKPSVARDIAAALGGFKKGDQGVLESSSVVVTSGLGHLVKLAVPAGTDKGWELSQLPFIPANFTLEGIEKTASQLKLIKSLLKRDDIDHVVNACDAGREGELIFRYIYLICQTKKPIKRMWLQSMTHEAIMEAYSHLRSDAEMQPLFQAAVSRSEADWLVGINATRAVTKLRELQGNQNDGVASAGRVQTPVLSLLYFRETAIKNFVPRDFWEIHGTFRVAAGAYGSKWFNPKCEKDDDNAAKADRLFTLAEAKAIEDKCRGLNPTSITEESKPSKSLPPKLYDLTTLQREANTKFGFTAKETLDLAQALYETHKVLTYPRTDATALPEDYVPTAKKTLATFQGTQYAMHADRVLSNDWVIKDKRIFDNSKITDHFAIIPNGNKPSGLNPDEQKIYDLVVRRFIAVFHPAAEYLQTTRITVVVDESFKSSGSVLMSEGWLAVYGHETSDESGKSLCKYNSGEFVETESIKSVGMQTKPPERYTEATLLGAMENAGKTIDDEKLKEVMKERGLGTPATRAAVIEELLSTSRNYMRRDKKYLVPTTKGMEIIALLLTNGVEALTSAQMTGEWEHKLNLIERGEMTRSSFMSEVKALTRHIVEQIKEKARSVPQATTVALDAPCPKCNGHMFVMPKTFACQSCTFKIWSEVAGRRLTATEASALLQNKVTPLLSGFIGKSKKAFSAKLRLSSELDKIEFEFEERVAPAPGEHKSLGPCPKCKAAVFASGDNYVCEKSFDSPKACDFILWGTVAKKRLDKSTVEMILSKRKSELVRGLMGGKGAFNAFLVLTKESKIAFEFEKR